MIGLIWDIQEEHLDELEFLLEMWTHCVDSPKFTLTTLRDGPEERLLARVAGLLVGGERVVDRLLLPVLAEPDDDEFRTAAASLAILEGAGLEACAQVLGAFDRANPRGHRGLVRGLQLSQRTGLIPWLARDLDALSGPVLASRLRVLAGHRVEAGARLIAWLNADDLDVRQAAASLARHTGAPEVIRHLYPSMSVDDDTLRWAAIESGLIRGMQGTWERVVHEAFSNLRAKPYKAALAWIAMLGDQSAHQRLLAELEAAPSAALLWAAGLSGRSRAVDIAVELLEHPQLGRPAGELVCAVAGLPSTDEQFWLDRGVAIGADQTDALPDLEDDDLDSDLTLANDDSLRLPNPDEVRFWWAQRRDRFQTGLRHCNGRPLDGAQLALALRELPTRRRHPLALELAARTHGRAQIGTRTMTAVQRAQTDTAFSGLGSGLDALDLQHGLPLGF